MSVTWGKTDLEYFRKLGIAVDDPEVDREVGGYIFVSWLLFWAVVGGASLYGGLLAVAWALRALNVVITGI
jgi:hypothetical protein